MRMRQIVAAGLAMAMATAAMPISAIAAGQATVTLSGQAKKSAKKPYNEYSTRARNAQTGDIAASVPNSDPEANFTFSGLPPANYLVELLNKDGKVVCTEGPFDLTQRLVKNDVDIACHRVPAAWWLLGVAGAAGITAGVLATDASPSR
jgi:hypothetical protein